LHKKVLPRLAALGARRIVYVACHHPAAAADARALEELGWRVERVQPIDMFPHTPHVECVLTLVPDPP
jgi:23S rRNA (uracil1939-C5)-methyltransferase